MTLDEALAACRPRFIPVPGGFGRHRPWRFALLERRDFWIEALEDPSGERRFNRVFTRLPVAPGVELCAPVLGVTPSGLDLASLDWRPGLGAAGEEEGEGE